MSLVALPHYSPPLSPTPDYSLEPAFGELSLQRGPRIRRPRSIFVKRDGHITIILNGQEEGVLYPKYGRSSMITGLILFERVDHTCEVSLHILGKLESTSSEGGPNATPLINKTAVLWNIEKDGNSFERPAQIKFAVQLPNTFDNGGTTQQLPPSYRVDFDTLPALMVRSSYALQFSFVRKPSRKLGILNKRKTVFIPFQYYPRTSSLRPLPHFSSLSSYIKTSPEEWHQATVAVKIPKKSELAPIYLHFFVPASCIYSIRKPIPFHLQLDGSVESLQAFLNLQQDQMPKTSTSKSGGSLGTRPSVKTPNIISLSPNSDDRLPTPRVSLLRRVTLQSKEGKDICRSQVMGVSKPRPVPPLLDIGDVCSLGDDHLGWEGMLCVGEEFETGSFRAGNVNIKDFIAISIMPHSEATSPLYGLEVTVPIKLVTDSFLEDGLIAAS